MGISYNWAIAAHATKNSDLEESNTGGGTNQALLWDGYIFKNVRAPALTGNPPSADRFSPFQYPHRGGKGLNWLYADGHVKLEAKS